MKDTDIMEQLYIPGLGSIPNAVGLIPLSQCSDGKHQVGKDGVISITATGDRKVEFISFEKHSLAYVGSSMGYPAYYPVHEVNLKKPVKAVLMDLDGTTVKSEAFWIWIIGKTIASLLDNPRFELEASDIPFVSGHSVSEHLMYCIQKYCPDKNIEEARKYYFLHTKLEMDEIMQGRGRKGAFTPTKGVKDLLLALKARGIRIGLVTSGLYEKAYPEILAAFDSLDLGDPKEFYDCIVTAGFPLRKGQVGTLGELSPKPHPWLYAEACRVGLGIPFEQRNQVVGIEDSGAGVCSIRLAGYPAVGIGGGNIIKSGTQVLCTYYCQSFDEVLNIIKEK